ncbi:hypothetical protein A2U01_0040504 [Trifolium medium]|uniref:RNA recognition motif n=1 Tax=Trifolium medium TaxID=97028 RepID=A0A392Q5F6_9FABA|nr:hypothetical protein [Trifolium medium]
MLEDVYVASKRNVHDEVYGFVKFTNVKNVNKLSKALNAVCFGNNRVQAKLASFDKSDKEEGRRPRTEKDETNAADGADTLTRPGKEGIDATEEVRVGEVLVRLGG